MRTRKAPPGSTPGLRRQAWEWGLAAKSGPASPSLWEGHQVAKPSRPTRPNRKRRATEASPHKALSGSLSPAWPQPPGASRHPISCEGKRGRLVQPPGSGPAPPLSRTDGRESGSQGPSITLLWVQSPEISGNGFLSASRATRIPQKAGPGRCAEHGGGRAHPYKETWTLSSEEQKNILLRELSAEGQGMTLFYRNRSLRRVMAISLGIPGLW